MRTRRHLLLWTLVGAALMPPAVMAGDRPLFPGDATDHLFAVQASGEQASSNPQAVTAVQRELAADRFLQTYKFPIKENYYGTTFKAGAAGGK